MTSLSGMFDGQQHWLEPDEYFPSTGATLVVDGWEELEEEDVLSPFESPSVEPILRETGREYSERYNQQFPLRATEQAWGALSVQLTALCSILGVSKKQYQHIWPGQGSTPDDIKWSFMTDEPFTERL